ncbi:MAG: hypothetical protein FJ112_03330 [Deltaproteobacteria bacterium]|nr:hypothetical protein [Deltaproteobacteria bacterium]
MKTFFSSISIDRIVALFFYHRWRQFIDRLTIKTFLPIKWLFFRCFLQMNLRTSIKIQDEIVKLQDFDLNLCPLLAQQTKIPAKLLQQLSDKDRLIFFERNTHSQWLHDSNPEAAWQEILTWIKSEISYLPARFPLSWHPYLISKRIQNWIALWVLSAPSEHDQEMILRALWFQATWLNYNFEYDIKGNHLWENAQALALAGSFLNCPKNSSWVKKGISVLKQQIPLQIHVSGEHFEKSPAYHAELTQGLAFLLPWIKKSQENFYWFENYFSKMKLFSSQIAHPTGILPYFNDTWLTRVTPNQDFFSDWCGDYYIHRNNTSFFIFDAGNMGSDSLPAHAHCDLLTFELSIRKLPLILNSGTYSYEGKERQYFRGSSAHNVLTVNNQNCADIWSSFRLGRRGHITNRGHLTQSDGVWIWSEHDGYAYLKVPKVLRLCFLSETSDFLCSLFLVLNHGTNPEIKEHVHLAPEVQINELETAFFAVKPSLQTSSDGECFFRPLYPTNTVKIEDTMFSPRFYVQQRKKTLTLNNNELNSSDEFQLATAWILNWGKTDPKIALEFNHQKIKLTWYRNNQPLEAQLHFHQNDYSLFLSAFCAP